MFINTLELWQRSVMSWFRGVRLLLNRLASTLAPPKMAKYTRPRRSEAVRQKTAGVAHFGDSITQNGVVWNPAVGIIQ
jgi:hypothetical protein